MEKVIVDNRTDFSTSEILTYVQKVMTVGKPDNGMRYPYITTWKLKDGRKLVVYAIKNKDSYRFVVVIKN